MKKNLVATLLILLSFILLIPGVTYKMFSMKLDAKISSNLGKFELDGLNKSYSILGTVEDLWDRDKILVSILILLFSVIFPIAKMLLYFCMLRFERYKDKLYPLLSYLSKWSMADVFVVAILLSYMATGRETQHAGTHELNVFGMKIGIKLGLVMSSELLSGFYFFLSSCFFSILSLSFFPIKLKGTELKGT